MSKVTLVNGSTPRTPDAGKTSIYVDTDKKIKTKDDAGTVVDLTASGTDVNAKVTSSDTTTGYLDTKVTVANGTNSTSPLEKSVTSPAGDERLELKFDESKVDHDATTNFIADEHVAHSAVSVTAGSGLSGGGAIDANRTINLDINPEASVSAAGGDEIAIADVSDSNNIKKVTAQSIADLAGNPALLDLSLTSLIRDDFITGGITTYGELVWGNGKSGTGAGLVSSTAHLDANHPGIATIKTGTTAAGYSNMNLFVANGWYIPGNGELRQTWICKLQDLSTAAQEFIARIGSGDSVTSADHSDGMYFEYDRTTSVNWLMCTANNTSLTKTATSTPAIDTDFMKFEIVTNAGATSSEYFIDDVSVGTVTENHPLNRNVSPIVAINKTVGTTERRLHSDLFQGQLTFTSPR